MSLDLLLIDAGFLIIRSFSVVHKLQALDPGLYDWHFVRILQFMLYLVPSFFNFQISFECSVASGRVFSSGAVYGISVQWPQ